MLLFLVIVAAKTEQKVRRAESVVVGIGDPSVAGVVAVAGDGGAA